MKSPIDRHVFEEVIGTLVVEHGQPNFLEHVQVSVAVAKGTLVVFKFFLAHVLSQLRELLCDRYAP